MNNKPETTLRDGSISVTIWKNASANGPFYTAEAQRTYTDADGVIKNAASFSRNEILRVSRLMTKAYDLIAELVSFDKAAEAGE